MPATLPPEVFVERPNMPAPIGRAPFKDNWKYWIGDRYAPMIEQVRRIADDIEPDAILMNGGWNRDYTGQRGDLLLGEGIGPYLDDYAFHSYSAGADLIRALVWRHRWPVPREHRPHFYQAQRPTAADRHRMGLAVLVRPEAGQGIRDVRRRAEVFTSSPRSISWARRDSKS